ncbi:hypothetical protein GCM10027036_18290 [Flavihumibacter cheonanensis]
MFLPQQQEVDVYDRHGQQLDDINSLAEFLTEVVFGYVDDTPEDEDSDNGQKFQQLQLVYYDYLPHYELINPVIGVSGNTPPAYYINTMLDRLSGDIFSPPPELA